MKSIAIVNQKGGCGKTSLSVLVSLALASAGKKVLAVDCDPQAGLTAFFTKSTLERTGIFDFLTSSNKTIEDVQVSISRDSLNVALVSADYRLDAIASNLDPYILQRKFRGVNEYDVVVFDTPPTVQGISRSAAMVADHVLVPADISEATKGPTLYTLTSLKDIQKKGQVVFIGYKDPKEDSHSFKSELSREFMNAVKGHYCGTIPKTVGMEKAIADINYKWTPQRKERILQPILEMTGLK
jgi:chromosome partitioning protein